LGIDAQLVPGRAGVFEVHAGERLVYSKATSGRFPNAGEVSVLLKSLKA
jgi:predicted Rdx family selenoprotein